MQWHKCLDGESGTDFGNLVIPLPVKSEVLSYACRNPQTAGREGKTRETTGTHYFSGLKDSRRVRELKTGGGSEPNPWQILRMDELKGVAPQEFFRKVAQHGVPRRRCQTRRCQWPRSRVGKHHKVAGGVTSDAGIETEGGVARPTRDAGEVALAQFQIFPLSTESVWFSQDFFASRLPRYMASDETFRKLRVFVACPGDVKDEKDRLEN